MSCAYPMHAVLTDECIAQGPAVIAEKLAYFIRTGQMVHLMQTQGLKVTYIQLARFWPLPGPAAPPPPPPPAFLPVDYSQDSFNQATALFQIIPITILGVAVLMATVLAILFCIRRRRRSRAVRSISQPCVLLLTSMTYPSMFTVLHPLRCAGRPC